MKVIGSDFDGTLTTNHVVLDSTRNLIQQFRKQGNPFIIVTGRSLPKFKEGILKYKIDFFDYVICANGAVVLDKYLKVLEKHIIDIKICEEIVKDLLQKNIAKTIKVNTIDMSYLITKIDDFYQIHDAILSIALAFETKQIRQQYTYNNPHVNIFSNNEFIDILSSKTSKAIALNNIYKQLHGDSLFVVGDGENDIPMFQVCENSYTFNTSDIIVKDEAKHVFDSIDEILERIIESD